MTARVGVGLDIGGTKVLGAIVDEAGIQSIYGLKIDIEGHEDKALVPFFGSARRR